MDWLGPLLTYLLGLLMSPWVGRVLENVFLGWRRGRARRVAARAAVDRQLDPLLKSADELHAKMRSLAEEDFREFKALPTAGLPAAQLIDLCSTLYLFAQFWGRLEVLRRESFHAEISATSQGALLLRFLRSLESRKVRLVDRAWQRAIGELVMERPSISRDAVTFRQFVIDYESGEVRRWVEPLEGVLKDTSRGPAKRRQQARQRLLQYGVVVQALIDTLDPQHRTTRDRPAYPNKLTRRAKRELIGRVFGVYLPEVKPENVRKYTGVSIG